MWHPPAPQLCTIHCMNAFIRDMKFDREQVHILRCCKILLLMNCNCIIIN